MKKRIILWTSGTWLTSHLSHWPSKPAYYTVDWQILVYPCRNYCSIIISGISWKFRSLWSSSTGLWLTSSASVPKIFLYADCVCAIFQRNCIFLQITCRRDKLQTKYYAWKMQANCALHKIYSKKNPTVNYIFAAPVTVV